MAKKQLLISILLLCVIFLLGLSVISCSETITSRKKKTTPQGLDVKKIENNLQKMKKSLADFPDGPRYQKTNLTRDPFISPVDEKKIHLKSILKTPTDQPVEETIIPTPNVHISGVICGNISMAIIDDEVKTEGEFLGEWQVYKIEQDCVLIKYKDKVFTYKIGP